MIRKRRLSRSDIQLLLAGLVEIQRQLLQDPNMELPASLRCLSAPVEPVMLNDRLNKLISMLSADETASYGPPAPTGTADAFAFALNVPQEPRSGNVGAPSTFPYYTEQPFVRPQPYVNIRPGNMAGHYPTNPNVVIGYRNQATAGTEVVGRAAPTRATGDQQWPSAHSS